MVELLLMVVVRVDQEEDIILKVVMVEQVQQQVLMQHQQLLLAVVEVLPKRLQVVKVQVDQVEVVMEDTHLDQVELLRLQEQLTLEAVVVVVMVRVQAMVEQEL